MCSTVPTHRRTRWLRAHPTGLLGLAVLAAGIGAQDLSAQARYDNIDHTRGEVSANERAMIEADVRRTVGLYYEYFSTGQAERMTRKQRAKHGRERVAMHQDDAVPVTAKGLVASGQSAP